MVDGAPNLNYYKKNIVTDNFTLSNCIIKISKAKIKTLFVTNKKKQLVGTISDGDIRRGILKYKNLEVKVNKIMRKNFFFLNEKKKIFDYKKLKKNNFLLIPLLDRKKNIIEIKNLDEIQSKKIIENPVLIMAGGLGKRLRPYTVNTPKPMLKINGKPILEKIICQFRENGFFNFYISTYFKSKKIFNYFKYGSRFKVKINYINEKKPLGTAGSLGLLPENENRDIIVANGDILTKLDPNFLLEYHKKNKFDLTVASINYNYQLPFGSIKVEKNQIMELEEKPKLTYKINAGIYVINSKIYKSVKKNKNISMTSLITKLLVKGKKIGAFPIYENWGDIGNKEILNKFNKKYKL